MIYAITKNGKRVMVPNMAAALGASYANCEIHLTSSYTIPSIATITDRTLVMDRGAIGVISTPITIACPVVMMPGSRFALTGDLMFSGSFSADHSLHFTGSGVVRGLKGVIDPVWWGALGDGSDQTLAIKAAFASAYGTYNTADKSTVHFSRGSYVIGSTVDINLGTSDYYTPAITGDGPDSVTFTMKAGFTPDTPMFRATGGSPGIFFQKWGGFKIVGLGISDHTGIQINNLGGIQIDNVAFESIKKGVQLVTSGGFAEFDTLTNCHFGYFVQYWLEYYGNSSYNGSGLGIGCMGNVVGSQRCVKLTQAGVGDPLVYNAPFNVMVWGDATTILWTHDGASPARLYGNIRYESGAAITLGESSVGTVQTFIGTFDGLAIYPNFGTFSVGASNGLSGDTFVAHQLRFGPAMLPMIYAEGVWTPALNGSTLGAVGKYTKVGRMVHISFGNQPMVVTAAAAPLVITGLPFHVYADHYDFSEVGHVVITDASDSYKKYPSLGQLLDNSDVSFTCPLLTTTSDPITFSLTYTTDE